MTTLQKIVLRQSEVRERLNELAGMETLDEAAQSELETLSGEFGQLEKRHRAAIMAGDPEVDPAPKPGADSLERLVDAADLGNIFAGAVEHRATTGPERELQDEFGLNSNQVPLRLLTGDQVEERAVTPAPANVGRTMAPILPAVFPRGQASWLGVEQPTVPTGDRTYPVIATSATVGEPAENAVQAETTGSFTTKEVTPGRLQASFFWSREAGARFSGMADALRRNLMEALSDQLDNRVLNTANGFLGSASPLAAVNDPGTTLTYALAMAELYNSTVLDGVYASMSNQVRMLVGAGTYALLGTLYRGTSDNTTALEKLNAVTGGVRIGAHIPAPSSNDQAMVVAKNPTLPGSAVTPIWDGVTMIPDEVTQAGAGQIRLTAVMLFGMVVNRPAAYRRREVQIA